MGPGDPPGLSIREAVRETRRRVEQAPNTAFEGRGHESTATHAHTMLRRIDPLESGPMGKNGPIRSAGVVRLEIGLGFDWRGSGRGR